MRYDGGVEVLSCIRLIKIDLQNVNTIWHHIELTTQKYREFPLEYIYHKP